MLLVDVVAALQKQTDGDHHLQDDADREEDDADHAERRLGVAARHQRSQLVGVGRQQRHVHETLRHRLLGAVDVNVDRLRRLHARDSAPLVPLFAAAASGTLEAELAAVSATAAVKVLLEGLHTRRAAILSLQKVQLCVRLRSTWRLSSTHDDDWFAAACSHFFTDSLGY